MSRFVVIEASGPSVPRARSGVARTRLLLTEDSGLLYGLSGQPLDPLRQAIAVAGLRPEA